jgi:hypothetical protein
MEQEADAIELKIPDAVALRGEVLLEERDAQGNILQTRKSNAVTYAMRNQILNLLAGQPTTTPQYIAVGVVDSAAEGMVTSADSGSFSDSTRNWANNQWVGYTVWITLGTGAGQFRGIAANVGTGCFTTPAWTSIPDSFSHYRILPSKDPRTFTQLPHEIARKALEDKRLGADFCDEIGIFRQGEAGGPWSHAMLIDQNAIYVTVHDCEVTTNWDSPGVGAVLSLDGTIRQEGIGSLRVDITGTTASSFIFRNAVLAVDGSPVNVSLGSLGFWLFISDVTKVSGDLTAELSSSATDGTSSWQWNIPKSSLITGWNFVTNTLNSAALNGTPNKGTIVRFKLTVPYVINSNGVIFRLDRLKLFQEAGTPLSIVQFQPTITKDVGSLISIRWRLQLLFSTAVNTMLWNGQDNTAVVADVSTTVTETGSGTFLTNGSHPWWWPKMWTPAAAGYMTIGGNSLDTKAGSIAIWSRFAVTGTGAPANNSILFDWRYDVNNRITIKYNAGSWVFEYLKAGVTTTVSAVDAYVTNGYRFVVVTWNNIGLSISVGSGAFVTTPLTAANTMDSLSQIDTTVGGASGLTSINTHIGPVLYFAQALSYADVGTLFALGRPYYYKES